MDGRDAVCSNINREVIGLFRTHNKDTKTHVPQQSSPLSLWSAVWVRLLVFKLLQFCLFL